MPSHSFVGLKNRHGLTIYSSFQTGHGSSFGLQSIEFGVSPLAGCCQSFCEFKHLPVLGAFSQYIL